MGTTTSKSLEISPETFSCASAVPSLRCTSSRNLGWKSLLVDVHEGTQEACYYSDPTPDQGIGVVLSGRYTSEIWRDGKWRSFSYCFGDVCLHSREETRKRRFGKNSRSAFHTAIIYVPCSLMNAAHDHYRRPGQASNSGIFHPFVRDPAIANVAGSLVHAIAQGAGEMYAETSAAWLAAHLALHHGDAKLQPRRAEQMTETRLHRVLGFISDRFAEALTLEDLASEACMSKFHFARVFRMQTGMTPHAYLTRVRLKNAVRMLEGTDLSVSAVGSACGFQSSAHFSRSFAVRYRVPPLTFRRRHTNGRGNEGF